MIKIEPLGGEYPLFTQLAPLMERPQLLVDERFVGDHARVSNAQTLDAIISAWTQNRPDRAPAALLNEADIRNCKVYTAAYAADAPQYRYRGMVRETDDPLLGPALHSGIVPHIWESPGAIGWPRPAIGQHSDEVLAELCGFDMRMIVSLRDAVF